jgi:hypothetical protein
MVVTRSYVETCEEERNMDWKGKTNAENPIALLHSSRQDSPQAVTVVLVLSR